MSGLFDGMKVADDNDSKNGESTNTQKDTSVPSKLEIQSEESIVTTVHNESQEDSVNEMKSESEPKVDTPIEKVDKMENNKTNGPVIMAEKENKDQVNSDPDSVTSVESEEAFEEVEITSIEKAGDAVEVGKMEKTNDAVETTKEADVTESGTGEIAPPPTSLPPVKALKIIPPSTSTQPVMDQSPNFRTDHALTSLPVSNPSALIRILTKFTEKAVIMMPHSVRKPNSIFSRIFGPSTGNGMIDPCLQAYSQLVSSLDDDDHPDLKPRQALSSFVHLVSTWAHSRTHLDLMSPASESSNLKNWITAPLLYLCIDSAQNLVAHGCLDHFYIILPHNHSQSLKNLTTSTQTLPTPDPVRAVNVLAESVFLSELSDEKTELAALKFLLTTGCRVMDGICTNANTKNLLENDVDKKDMALTTVNMSEGEAMLRGTHLLQTIRVCYHVFLKTGSASNKTTARAALQQLVASVFVRMEQANTLSSEIGQPTCEKTGLDNDLNSSAISIANDVNLSILEDVEDKDMDDKHTHGGMTFPTPDHRDAFLVLRSLCKLSMKVVPDAVNTAGASRNSRNARFATRRVSNANEGGVTWATNDQLSVTNAASNIVTNPKETDDKQTSAQESSTTNTTSNLIAAPSPQSRPKAITSPKLLNDPILSTSTISPLSQNPALESKILALELILYILSLDYQTSRTLNSSSQMSSSSSFANHLAASQPFQFAMRHYLCVSLLKNSTSNITSVVGLSLRIFVPLIRHFRSHLKTEIEAFVTNVFFVILDSSNSTMEHKSLVVTLFEEICSDPDTLAEIFLNYDCDLSAVDLFHRIVNTLGKVAKIDENKLSAGGDVSSSELETIVGGGAEKRKAFLRQAIRQLRLDAMRALRQVLASLHASIVTPFDASTDHIENDLSNLKIGGVESQTTNQGMEEEKKQNSLVQIYDSKKKFKEEQLEVILRFNRSPLKGIAYAGECGHIDADDPVDVARYLLKNGNDGSKIDKTQIGEFLGREAEYKDGFCLKVLHEYTNLLDFEKMDFDEAIRFFLSGFRLPGEAQKIDRIMEKFAERYCYLNPSIFPTADAAFILAFAVIMLNTDLHNPAIKEERRMTIEAFIRMNRGICEGEDLPDELLNSIFNRIKTNPISLKEDDDARARAGLTTKSNVFISPALSPAVFFGNHYDEMERTRENNFLKERDQILRTTESLFKRKRRSKTKSIKGQSSSRSSKMAFSKFVRTRDTGLRDEYVTPMFEVTWGACLAVFSTALESANGTASASAWSTFSDEEKDMAIENGVEATEVCLTGFRLAICTAGLCGNETARGAFIHALLNFTLLGSGKLMENRHVRCVQALLRLGYEDGELLGDAWEHIFKALSQVSRLNQVYEVLARNERTDREKKTQLDEEVPEVEPNSESDDDDNDDSSVEAIEDMDRRSIDESNARAIYEALPATYVDDIFHRSSSLSGPAVKDFILQLCRVSRMEISGYGGHVGSRANQVDVEKMLQNREHSLFPVNQIETIPGHNQPVIYSLQKLVEVTHYNMDSRPRLIFADLWANISGHLTSTALHSNPAVALYAVDSFRQLSIHFLQLEELGVFEFQRRFMAPFEIVMVRSEYVSTKELVIKCVEQIILMFGTKTDGKEQGVLRGGWRPVLSVLGQAGHDDDDGIATTGFKLLNEQLKRCLMIRDASSIESQRLSIPSSLVTDHFINLVDALSMFISGRRIDMSLKSIDHLIELSTLVADGLIPLPTIRKKLNVTINTPSQNSNDGVESKGRSSELELWWPILLGLSQSIGDDRRAVREKALKSLLDMIKTFFLRDNEELVEEKMADIANQDLQTLQLIYRGILIPTLEYAETHMDTMSLHPNLFPHFITLPPVRKVVSKADSSPYNDLLVNDDDLNENSWIITTFGPLLDGCISICMRAMEIYKSDALIEEVLAVINSCLLSDSGALAVTGLRGLQKFITVDLSSNLITDDTWAAVCHMLRNSLSVRGLPSVLEAVKRKKMAHGGEYETQKEDERLINEFKLEEDLYSGRRYIGCNAAMVIGSLVCDRKFSSSIGKQWYVFLMKGLASGIQDWEQAASIIGTKLEGQGKIKSTDPSKAPSPPHYLENALYGRQWMGKLILIAAQESIKEEDGNSTSKARLSLLKEETQTIISNFLDKEAKVDELARATSQEELILGACRSAEVGYFTQLVCELLDGINKFDNAALSKLSWLCPMLSSLIQSNNKALRVVVHVLVSRMFEGPMSPN